MAQRFALFFIKPFALFFFSNVFGAHTLCELCDSKKKNIIKGYVVEGSTF
jgi:hypothetical protein